MDSAWVGVIGTLGGVAIGWVGNMASQSQAHRREADERLANSRRETYLRWLERVHFMFEEIAQVQRKVSRGTLSSSDASDQLRDVSSTDAQTALEDLRLIATDDLAAAAAAIWTHMRRHLVPIGRETNRGAWQSWRSEYWVLRHAFLDAARAEIGFKPLDWAQASVTPVNRP